MFEFSIRQEVYSVFLVYLASLVQGIDNSFWVYFLKKQGTADIIDVTEIAGGIHLYLRASAALLSIFIIHRIKREIILLLSAGSFLLAWLVIVISSSISALYLTKALSGIAGGFLDVLVCLVYNTVADTDRRKAITYGTLEILLIALINALLVANNQVLSTVLQFINVVLASSFFCTIILSLVNEITPDENRTTCSILAMAMYYFLAGIYSSLFPYGMEMVNIYLVLSLSIINTCVLGTIVNFLPKKQVKKYFHLPKHEVSFNDDEKYSFLLKSGM